MLWFSDGVVGANRSSFCTLTSEMPNKNRYDESECNQLAATQHNTTVPVTFTEWHYDPIYLTHHNSIQTDRKIVRIRILP